MLSDCKVGDWVKFQHFHEYFYLGVVTDITDSGRCYVDYKAKYDNIKSIWLTPPKYLKEGYHNLNNNSIFISKYEPSIKEVFEMNKLKE